MKFEFDDKQVRMLFYHGLLKRKDKVHEGHRVAFEGSVDDKPMFFCLDCEEAFHSQIEVV